MALKSSIKGEGAKVVRYNTACYTKVMAPIDRFVYTIIKSMHLKDLFIVQQTKPPHMSC